MTLATLFAYSDRCRAVLAALLHEHPELLHRPFTTTSQHDTIAKLLAHTIAAEERWLARVSGDPLPEPYEGHAPQTLEALLADAETLRAKTKTLLAAQTPESLAVEHELQLRGTPYRLTVEEHFFTIVNHEQWHRAQITTVLQTFGIEPPDFDFVLLRP